MSNLVMNIEKKDFNWNQESTYKKVNTEINKDWPQWKKEAYNEMFAISTHATKIEIKKCN